MRYTVLGLAATELIIDAPNAKAAAKEWKDFQKQHQRGRRGDMTVRLLFDPPAILKSDGQRCEIEGITSKRSETCRALTE